MQEHLRIASLSTPASDTHHYEDRYFFRGRCGLGSERFCALHLPAA